MPSGEQQGIGAGKPGHLAENAAGCVHLSAGERIGRHCLLRPQITWPSVAPPMSSLDWPLPVRRRRYGPPPSRGGCGPQYDIVCGRALGTVPPPTRRAAGRGNADHRIVGFQLRLHHRGRVRRFQPRQETKNGRYDTLIGIFEQRAQAGQTRRRRQRAEDRGQSGTHVPRRPHRVPTARW